VARAPDLKTILILPDLHVPEHDQIVWDALLQWLREHPVSEIVLLGDFLELASCSQHPGTDFTSLNEDFKAGRQVLKELLTACPKGHITLLEGNHETRLARITASKLPQLADNLSIAEGLRLAEIGATWVPEDEQPITRGDLELIHGHQALGEGFGARYHAAKMVDVYGEPGHTVVYGHTHKQQAILKASKRGNQLGLGLGALRTMRPDWLHGREAGWCHQFAVACVRANGHTDVMVVSIRDGAFVWDGKLYTGRRHG
jgi:predicted phosphodiesterase